MTCQRDVSWRVVAALATTVVGFLDERQDRDVARRPSAYSGRAFGTDRGQGHELVATQVDRVMACDR